MVLTRGMKKKQPAVTSSHKKDVLRQNAKRYEKNRVKPIRAPKPSNVENIMLEKIPENDVCENIEKSDKQSQNYFHNNYFDKIEKNLNLKYDSELVKNEVMKTKAFFFEASVSSENETNKSLTTPSILSQNKLSLDVKSLESSKINKTNLKQQNDLTQDKENSLILQNDSPHHKKVNRYKHDVIKSKDQNNDIIQIEKQSHIKDISIDKFTNNLSSTSTTINNRMNNIDIKIDKDSDVIEREENNQEKIEEDCSIKETDIAFKQNIENEIEDTEYYEENEEDDDEEEYHEEGNEQHEEENEHENVASVDENSGSAEYESEEESYNSEDCEEDEEEDSDEEDSESCSSLAQHDLFELHQQVTDTSRRFLAEGFNLNRKAEKSLKKHDSGKASNEFTAAMLLSLDQEMANLAVLRAGLVRFRQERARTTQKEGENISSFKADN